MGKQNPRDKKLLQYVNAGYDTMHITMGYDLSVLCHDKCR